jgi:hypothetical protein
MSGAPGRRNAVIAAVACVALGAAGGGGVVAASASGAVAAPKSCLNALDVADRVRDDLDTVTTLLLRIDTDAALEPLMQRVVSDFAILNGARYIKASRNCRIGAAR